MRLWWRLLLPGAVFAWLLVTIDWGVFLRLLTTLDPWLLLAAAGLNALLYPLQGWRWGVLLAVRPHPWGMRLVQRVNFQAAFFDLLIPGRLGSDACRLASLPSSEDPAARHHILATLLFQRLQGLAVAVATLLAMLAWQRGGILAAAAVMVLTLGLGWLVMRRLPSWSWNRSGRVAAFLAQVVDAVGQVAHSPRPVATTTLMAILGMPILAGVYALLGQATGMRVGFDDYLLGVAAIMAASAIPVTVQGRGLAEGLAILLWQGEGATIEQILFTTLGAFCLGMAGSLLAGLSLLPRGSRG